MLDSGRLLLHAFLALPPAARNLQIHELVRKNKSVASMAKKPAPPAFVADYEREGDAFFTPYLQTLFGPDDEQKMQGTSTTRRTEVLLADTEDALSYIPDNGASLGERDAHDVVAHSFVRGTRLAQPMCFAH